MWIGLVIALAGCGADAHVSKNTLLTRRSIGPISFLETKAKIEAAYGKGQVARFISGTAHVTVTFYPAVSVGVIYLAGPQGKPVVGLLETTAPQYRTMSGIGVGSTLRQLKANGAECGPANGSCGLGISASKPGITFFLDDRRMRVTRVAISTGT